LSVISTFDVPGVKLEFLEVLEDLLANTRDLYTPNMTKQYIISTARKVISLAICRLIVDLRANANANNITDVSMTKTIAIEFPTTRELIYDIE
jgi:hypothetical protein